MFDTPFMITAEMMARSHAQPADNDKKDDRAGNADSRTLAKEWRAGRGNTSDRNFVTPKDAENTETFEDKMAEKGEAAFTGKY